MSASVQGVQDNGIDPLTDKFGRCLEFIGKQPPFSAVFLSPFPFSTPTPATRN